MDGYWIDKLYCMQGWLDECTVSRDGWMEGWMNEGMDALYAGMDGWMYGC